MGTRDDDFVERLFIATNHETFLYFTNKGKVYALKVYEIPEAGPSAKGRALVNLLTLEEGEKILGMLPTRGCFDESHCLVMATREGLDQEDRHDRVRLHPHQREDRHHLPGGRRTRGRRRERGAATTSSSPRATASASPSPRSEVRSTGRTSMGVIGIRLREGDRVVEMEILRGAVVESSDEEGQGKAVAMEGDILTVTERGYGKRTPLGHYRIQGRGGYGVINIQVTAKNGPVVGGLHVHDQDEIMVITAGGQILRTPVKGISRVGRRTQGYKLITPNAGDQVAALAHVVAEEAEPEIK